MMKMKLFMTMPQMGMQKQVHKKCTNDKPLRAKSPKIFYFHFSIVMNFFIITLFLSDAMVLFECRKPFTLQQHRRSRNRAIFSFCSIFLAVILFHLLWLKQSNGNNVFGSFTFFCHVTVS